VILPLKLVDHAEHLTNGFVLARDSEAHVVSVLLEEFNASKHFADGFDGSIEIALGEQLLS